MNKIIDAVKRLYTIIRQKGDSMNTDIKFWVGVIMVILGQHMSIQPMTMFSTTIFTNTVQLTGVFLAVWHAVLTIYLVIKYRK